MKMYLVAALTSVLFASAFVTIQDSIFAGEMRAALGSANSGNSNVRTVLVNAFDTSVKIAHSIKKSQTLRDRTMHRRWLYVFGGLFLSSCLVISFGCGTPSRPWRGQIE
ncbi:MAG: hypothetical protein ACI9BW_000938 [Gammaproteobacteria bacterium]|jgi:hypothetical protein